MVEIFRIWIFIPWKNLESFWKIHYKWIDKSISGLKLDGMTLTITQNNGAVFASFSMICRSQVFYFLMKKWTLRITIWILMSLHSERIDVFHIEYRQLAILCEEIAIALKKMRYYRCWNKGYGLLFLKNTGLDWYATLHHHWNMILKSISYKNDERLFHTKFCIFLLWLLNAWIVFK